MSVRRVMIQNIRAKSIIAICFILAVPYLLLEYLILTSAESCATQNCSKASIDGISQAERLAGYLYPSTSRKAKEIAYAKARMLLALYQRVPAIRVFAISSLYKISSLEDDDSAKTAYLLTAMRKANSLGEFGLANAMYEDAINNGFLLRSTPVEKSSIDAEISFAKLMELIPYMQREAKTPGTVNVIRLRMDMEVAKDLHERAIASVCASDSVECKLAKARYKISGCFIYESKAVSRSMCISEFVREIQSRGVYLTPSNISSACAGKEALYECSDLAGMRGGSAK